MAYAFNYKNSENFDFNSDDDSMQTFPHFQNGEIINELEIMIIDLLEMILGNRFRYCPQVPLEIICSRPENFSRLPDEIWKFWVSSKVDIALIDRTFPANRKAKLVIECQSHWHDSLEAQLRDRKKAKLLASVNVPLIYVRRIAEDQRYYRFYTPNEKQEVVYNIITQQGWAELEAFLQSFL
jgi:Uma2 family endonuclease